MTQSEKLASSNDLNAETKVDTSLARFTDKNLALHKSDIKQLDALIVERIDDLLNSVQLDQFLQNQEQMRHLKES